MQLTEDDLATLIKDACIDYADGKCPDFRALARNFLAAYNAGAQPMPQTDAARDAKRLDWLMQHVCCDDFPGISIDLGLSREEHYAEFRRQIDAEIERLDRRGE